jgi:hypothetical protein
MSINEVKVNRIEAIEGESIFKTMGNSGNNVFKVKVNYVLENEEIVPYYLSHRLKRDTKAELESLPSIPKFDTRLMFDDNGKILGESVTYSFR